MLESNYNLGIRPDVGEFFPSGIAYVVIPSDVERSKYIAECYRTSTVSIYSEHNGFFNRVPVDQFTLSFIEFPNTIGKLGSAVGYKIDPIHKRPVIDGRYFKQDELCDLKENQFKFKRTLGSNVVEIAGSPDGKYIAVNVIADKGGEIDLNVSSKDESAAININVDGACNITALTDTNIKQYGKLSLLTVNRGDKDEVTLEEHTSVGRNIYSTNERITTDSLKINEGDQNFVLGQLFKAFLQDFIKEVSNATVTTDQGEMPLINADAIAEYAKDEKIDKFLSQIAYLDK